MVLLTHGSMCLGRFAHQMLCDRVPDGVFEMVSRPGDVAPERFIRYGGSYRRSDPVYCPVQRGWKPFPVVLGVVQPGPLVDGLDELPEVGIVGSDLGRPGLVTWPMSWLCVIG